METPSYEYWGNTQGQYIQHNLYDYTSCDMSAVPSLSGSPTSTTFEQPIPHSMPVYSQYPTYTDDAHHPYNYGMTPSSSSDESPYCSPRQQTLDIVGAYAPLPPQQTQEKQHTTSGRRRAQNRAAQRAFRERKERHAKDLETQLAALTDKYRSLETSHTELTAAYDKLRKTIEVLTKDESGGGGGDTLRKLLEILHGEVRERVKREEGGG